MCWRCALAVLPASGGAAAVSVTIGKRPEERSADCGVSVTMCECRGSPAWPSGDCWKRDCQFHSAGGCQCQQGGTQGPSRSGRLTWRPRAVASTWCCLARRSTSSRLPGRCEPASWRQAPSQARSPRRFSPSVLARSARPGSGRTGLPSASRWPTWSPRSGRGTWPMGGLRRSSARRCCRRTRAGRSGQAPNTCTTCVPPTGLILPTLASPAGACAASRTARAQSPTFGVLVVIQYYQNSKRRLR